MRFAVIENNTVTNIVEAQKAADIAFLGRVLPALDHTAAGDTLINGELPPPVIPDPPSGEEITAQTIADYTARVQARLDGFARSKGYDSVLSACSYASSGNPQFKAEGLRAVELRDLTWAKAQELLNGFKPGETIPSWEGIESQLPVLAWEKD